MDSVPAAALTREEQRGTMSQSLRPTMERDALGVAGYCAEDVAGDQQRKDRVMATPEDVIRGYVDATSAADGDAAAALTADDAVIELPDGAALKGKEGARQFAAKHAEADGQKQGVR